MNILYTITRYWPAIGGAETHVRQVASVLSTRHQIDVFAHTTDQRVDPIRVSTVDTPQDHPAYARQLGENGYQKVQQNYTTERVATSLEQVYDSHCGKGVVRGD